MTFLNIKSNKEFKTKKKQKHNGLNHPGNAWCTEHVCKRHGRVLGVQNMCVKTHLTIWFLTRKHYSLYETK